MDRVGRWHWLFFGKNILLRNPIDATTLEAVLQRKAAGLCHGDEREVWWDQKEDKTQEKLGLEVQHLIQQLVASSMKLTEASDRY